MKKDIEIKYTHNGALIKASSNYIQELDCYEVELLPNEKGADTLYRIELIDNDYLNITASELKALKALLNHHTLTYLLGL